MVLSFPRKREPSQFNKLDSRFRGITSDLPACGLSRMASSYINDDLFSVYLRVAEGLTFCLPSLRLEIINSENFTFLMQVYCMGVGYA